MTDTEILNHVLDILRTNKHVNWDTTDITVIEEFENIIDFIEVNRELRENLNKGK